MKGQQHLMEQAEASENPVWVRGRWGARYYPTQVSPAELQARSRATRPAVSAPRPAPPSASVDAAPAPRRFSIDAETVRVDVALDRSWDVRPVRPRIAARTTPSAAAPRTQVSAEVAAPPARRPSASPRQRGDLFASGEFASRARLQSEVRPAEQEARAEEAYPEWLDSRDLQVRLTHDPDRTTRHFEQRVRTQPECGAGWVGLALVALSRGQVKQAANLLVRCHELEPGFACGRLVKESFEGRPELWYDLARALVETNRRPAYECADLILQECVRCERSSVNLRRRAIRVRADITLALDARERRDRRTDGSKDRRPLVAAGLALLAALAVVACLGLLPV